MTSSTEMCNMATSHLGISTNIGDLDTSTGPNAAACRRFFEVALNRFQRDFPYAFSTQRVVMGLVQNDPVDEWQYEYRYPANCQYAGRIVTGFTNDDRQTIIPFNIHRDGTGRVIWTNQVDACLEFQTIETDSSRYQPDFVLAFSFHLAALIAPRVTAGDPFKLGPDAAAKYDKAVRQGQAASLNEQQEEEPPQSEFTRSQFSDTLFGRGEDWRPFPDNKDIL